MYPNQNALEIGAMGQVMWTWPFSVGLPTLLDYINAVFPRPSTDIALPWTPELRDKLDRFVGHVQSWFSRKVGLTATQEEFQAWFLEACAYAAEQEGFDLWGPDGLPSFPEYVPAVGGGE